MFRFRFLSADEVPIGAFQDGRVFDRHKRVIGRCESVGLWLGYHVVDDDGDPIVHIRNGRVTTIEFLTTTTTELRLLMICTMLAARVIGVYKRPDDGA
jgi:hypothetical protein